MAQLKDTTINDTGFIRLPVGTTAQQPGQGNQPPAEAGQVRFNTNLNIVEWYDDQLNNWFPVGLVRPSATGGTITNINLNNVSYRVHTFNSNGTFTLERNGTIEYLIVGGGGPGGASRSSQGGGGGGGGGGVLMGSLTLPAGDYPVVVGAGGIKPTANTNGTGSNGQASTFARQVALGGGAGGNGSSGGVGTTGASGGGGGYAGYTNQGNGGTPLLGQGFHGGNVISGSASGAGGGGAGQAGFSNSNSGGPGNGGTGGEGGSGIFTDFNGTLRQYGKGGQGGNANIDGDPPANTGTGGRGTYASSNNHRNGASGVVIIRYRTD